MPGPIPPSYASQLRPLLFGLPLVVFAVFGAIVRLAYDHGSQRPLIGESLLVKAPATAFKLAADESQDDLAEGGEVLDILSDTAPDEPIERLLPLSAEPLAPVEVTATTEPAPDRFWIPAPQIGAPSPEEPRIAELPPQRTEPQSAASAPEPPPEEAEAALDALFAEFAEQAEAAREPAPAAANGSQSSTVRPAVAAPAPQPTSPAPTTPAGPPSGKVTAIAPDRPSASGVAGTAGTRQRTAAVDGPFRIQLTALRDEADARHAWDLFQVDLGPVLSGLEPIIERADTANGVFYRVQIGSFASLQEADAVCDQLKQRSLSCFVVGR